MSGVALREVSADEADIRLDRWFRRHYPQVTHALIARLCRTGQVRVDGRRVEAATRLLPGQSVRVPPLPAAPAPPPAPKPDPGAAAELERMLLYRDDQLLVLNKPPGLPTQGGPGIARHLDGMLAAWASGTGQRPRLVHRLDRDTSGVLVVARTPGVAGKLAAAFRTRAVEKVYWAVVIGRPVPVEGRIDVMLSRHDPGPGGARVALAAPDDPDAARAITEYRTLDHAGRRFAWLELRPLTGRTHQLRVHCAAIGAPILGDAAYGGVPGAEAGTTLLEAEAQKLHLHARRLVLPHPAGGMLAVEAELPAHMAATFRALGFVAPAARAAQRR
jgi:23S rRNA pseudouridine955/2504/2580 synthase